MPVTPRFTVSQVDDAVVVFIKVPHVRVGGAETYVEGREFSFYCKPYLLRLTFPCDLRRDEDDNCKAVYDPNDDNGTVTVNLAKAVPGQHFPDLDLTTSLMQPRWTPGDLGSGGEGGVCFPSGVEVISSERHDEDFHREVDDGDSIKDTAPPTRAPNSGDDDLSCVGGSKKAAGDFKEEQESDLREGPGRLEPDVLIRPPHYGFNDRFTGVFTATRGELGEAIQLPEPDKTPPSAREGLRLEHEKAAFNADRYLADSFSEDEDPLLLEALAFEPHWRQRPQIKLPGEGILCEAASQNAGGDESAGDRERRSLEHEDERLESLTEREQEQMRRLPNRDYLIPTGGLEERRVLLGLADVLFAYAYDHRTTGGEPTVESGWTVAVLSPLLSWLESPQGDIDEMCVASSGMRRSLTFPYLRVWPLAKLVVRDVGDILAAGKRCVLRCLLQTYGILERGDVYYLLNKLFIEDYCVWIQKVPDASLQAFAERYASSTACLDKKALGLDLEKIEEDALGAAACSFIDGDSSDESSEECSESSEEYSEGSSDETSHETSDESSEECPSDDSNACRDDDASEKDQEDDAGKTRIMASIKDGENIPKDGACAAGTVQAKVSDASDEQAIASALEGFKLGTKQDNCTMSGGDERSAWGPHSVPPRSSELLQLELNVKGEGDDENGVSGIADRLSILRVGKPSVSPELHARDPGVEESGSHGGKTLIEEL